MDMSGRENCSSEKNEEYDLNQNNAGFSSDWQFRNPSIGFVSIDPQVPGQGVQRGSTPCPSASMGDSFNPGLWKLCDGDIPAIGKPVPGTSRLDVGWNPSDSLSRGGSFLPPSPSHFPADSAFIKRAAMLSCFNATSLPGMANPFSTSHSLRRYSNASRGVADAQAHNIDINTTESLKDASLPGSPTTEQNKGSLHDVEFEEADLGAGGHQNAANLASAAEDSSSRGLGSKKRKRSNEDFEVDQTKGDPQMPTETKENVDTNQKPNGKQAKDVSEAPKEDYIHVRARRGQATNSHSLAERVRREKISQRMKFLQELVPGCSKVTGKAVMLDEIINYVQSLQRQVEFLSMKLAAVNPRLDFNIVGLLSKDLLGPSSTIGFSPDMVHPQLYLSQQGLMQAGISGNLNTPNAFRRAINAQLSSVSGFKGPTTQMPNAWDEQLQNVMQIAAFGDNPQQPRTQ